MAGGWTTLLHVLICFFSQEQCVGCGTNLYI